MIPLTCEVDFTHEAEFLAWLVDGEIQGRIGVFFIVIIIIIIVMKHHHQNQEHHYY